jgi:hypothetical protein
MPQATYSTASAKPYPSGAQQVDRPHLEGRKRTLQKDVSSAKKTAEAAFADTNSEHVG